VATNGKRTLVIGVGNPLRRDDGVGIQVVRALAEKPLPDGVEAIDAGTGGLDLLFDLEEADRVVLVDAAEMGQAPGEVRVFDAAILDGKTEVRFTSLHGFGVAEVVALGRAVGVEPRMTIVGIQPADVSPGEGLSPALAARLPEYLALAEGALRASCEP